MLITTFLKFYKNNVNGCPRKEKTSVHRHTVNTSVLDPIIGHIVAPIPNPVPPGVSPADPMWSRSGLDVGYPENDHGDHF